MNVNRLIGLFLIPLAAFLTAIGQPGSTQQRPPTVVLDPGHGWKVGEQIDKGATSGDLIEKDINLDVARHTRNFLDRCPIDVHLTRDGDAPNLTKQDIDEIVNALDPKIGISIHTNSGTGNPSGTEGWHTVKGYNDVESQRLAALLADSISSRFQIPNRGIKPETQNRHGGLYTHLWDAPSALIEIAFLQGDAELLRERRADFGRSIAQATLQYLEMNPHCADWATPESWEVATYFPGDSRANSVELRNNGLMSWKPLDYFLISAGNEYGADKQYLLQNQTDVDEVAAWEISVVAPTRPGVYRQQWQLVSRSEAVGKKATVYIIVVPEEARELKHEIDRRIEDLQQRGDQEMQKFIDNLEEEALQWATRELLDFECFNSILTASVIIGAAFWLRPKPR